MSCYQTEILPNTPEIDQLQKELFQARYDANFYKSHYNNGIAIRERMRYEHDVEIRNLKEKHKKEIEQIEYKIKELEAKVRLRERQLFGKKSERGSSSKASKKRKKSNKSKGQQKGKKSPPKRDYSHLPIVEDIQDIPESDRFCPCCQCLYTDINTTEDSDILEVHVEAHVRRVKRKKYRRTCNCHSQPIILTAPQVPKVLSKSHLGNSIVVHFLMQKFWHGQPLHRIIQELNSHGLSIPAGTIVSSLLRLLPLLKIVNQKIIEKSLLDNHWHADETGWKVFEEIIGKVNNRWFLGMVQSWVTLFALVLFKKPRLK